MRNFFDAGSPYLSHPLLTPERTAAEVDRVVELVGVQPARVLDIGCGFGRHVIEFSSRSADVLGVDPSATMIAEARSRAAAANQAARFECGTADQIAEPAAYDLVLCLFSSLGQQTQAQVDDAPHRALLASAFAALRPGGAFVLELFDKQRAVAGLIESEQLGPTSVTRSFDVATSIVTERFELPTGDTYQLIYRLFGRDELADWVRDAGFEIEQVFDHGLVEPPTNLMTFVVRRPVDTPAAD